MLPKIDGLTVLTSIRSRGNDVHILILSANDQTEDRIRGLDLGADDYLVKPFAFDELVSRLRALSRRSNGTKNPLIEIEGVKIHSVSRYVYFDGKEVPFTPPRIQYIRIYGTSPQAGFFAGTTDRIYIRCL